MLLSVSNQAFSSRSRLFIKLGKVICPALVLIGLAFVGGWWRTAYASQQKSGVSPVLADQGGIQGYVVGSAPVAAYTCPDIVHCAVKLTLHPGTVVLIVDNVIGSNVPALNSNAWRKIVYQGLTLYVPLVYIRVGTPGTLPDISLVETSDASFTQPVSAHQGTTFNLAPGSASLGVGGGPGSGPLPPWAGCLPPNGTLVRVAGSVCCPPGYSLFSQSGNFYQGTLVVTCSAPRGLVTWYTATDGRINGNAGDRIAIYCRKTGRIEVWSINDSLGHFLVEFNHLAVDAAGKAGFSVAVPGQGIVAINGDGHGHYWASISGSPFHATGAGDFAKTFQCYATT